MARKPHWRDGTKLSCSGLLLPRFRISLPSGDAVIEHGGLPVGTAIISGSFHLRCSNMGIYGYALKATDPISAQKEAVELLRKRFAELQSLCKQNLEALEDIPSESFAVADPSLFELRSEPTNEILPQTDSFVQKESSKKKIRKAEIQEDNSQEKLLRKRAAAKEKSESSGIKEDSAAPLKRTHRKVTKR